MVPVLVLIASLCLQASDTREYQITLTTKDGTVFTGNTQLPAKLALSTKFGDLSPEITSVGQISRNGDTWVVQTSAGPLTGKVKLGTIQLVTVGGTLKIPEDEIQTISVRVAVESPVPHRAPPAGAAVAKPTPVFPGVEFREKFTDDPRWERHCDFALLLSKGKHLAVLDRETSQCVFIELATGNKTRVRVDTGAVHMIERSGKVYVANSQAKTITVIDAATLQSTKVIPVNGMPKWFAAPAFGSVVIVAVEQSDSKLQRLDTQTDTFVEPIEYGQQEQNYLGGPHFVQVTPDNQTLVVISSGLVDPTLFELNANTIGSARRMGEKHWPSFVDDFAADRAYFGSHVYSADLKKRLASVPTADILVPHPTRRLIFGRKWTPPRPSQIEVNRGTTVLVLDEETISPVKEIEIGDRVLAIVPSEEFLYVVSETRMYPINLKTVLPAESLAAMKPVRNPVDLSQLAASQTTTRRTSYSLPRLGGWTLLGDQKTLVVSLTEKAELLYINSGDGEEIRRVSLDFQPGALAVQGDTLYAIRANSSLFSALEAQTGKLKKEIKVPGDPLVRIACAQTGRLYASTAKGTLLSIDPSSGSAANTGARGVFLQVDPKGQFVYSGRTSPNDWGVEVEQDKDGRTTWYYDDWGYRTMIRKYAITGTSLKEVSVNDNAAVNGRSMVMSPDGSKIAVAGGGGWRPKRAGGGAGGYTIAIYDTKDLTTMLGQVDLGAYPENIAFHPVLDIGATLKSEAEITLFNTKSMAVIKRWSVKGAPRGFNEPGALKFGGQGETLLYWQMADSTQKAQKGRLFLIPLDLSAEEKAALQKVYGTPAASSDGARLFKEAEEAEQKGDKATAAKLYRQIIQEHPATDLAARASRKLLTLDEAPAGVAAGWLKTARALLENGETARALRYYKRIVDEQPESPEAPEARKKIQELEKK